MEFKSQFREGKKMHQQTETLIFTGLEDETELGKWHSQAQEHQECRVPEPSS